MRMGYWGINLILTKTVVCKYKHIHLMVKKFRFGIMKMAFPIPTDFLKVGLRFRHKFSQLQHP